MELRDRHGVSVMDVTPEFNPITDSITLHGCFLNSGQRKKLRSQLQNKSFNIVDRTEILADKSPTHPEQTWFLCDDFNGDLLDKPKGECTTQIIQADILVRKLWQWNEWSLIQTPDMAMGWILTEILPPPSEISTAHNHPWNLFIRPQKNRLINQTLHFIHLDQTAETLLNTPYRWGGRLKSGIDCSGMVQRIFMTHNVLLPKNSRDQRRCGIRIPMSNASDGDLIFAVGKTKKLHHAGMVLQDTIQHACRRTGFVIRDTMEQFQNKYRVIGVRRIASVE